MGPRVRFLSKHVTFGQVGFPSNLDTLDEPPLLWQIKEDNFTLGYLSSVFHMHGNEIYVKVDFFFLMCSVLMRSVISGTN